MHRLFQMHFASACDSFVLDTCWAEINFMRAQTFRQSQDTVKKRNHFIHSCEIRLKKEVLLFWKCFLNFIQTHKWKSATDGFWLYMAHLTVSDLIQGTELSLDKQDIFFVIHVMNCFFTWKCWALSMVVVKNFWCF